VARSLALLLCACGGSALVLDAAMLGVAVLADTLARVALDTKPSTLGRVETARRTVGGADAYVAVAVVADVHWHDHRLAPIGRHTMDAIGPDLAAPGLRTHGCRRRLAMAQQPGSHVQHLSHGREPSMSSCDVCRPSSADLPARHLVPVARAGQESHVQDDMATAHFFWRSRLCIAIRQAAGPRSISSRRCAITRTTATLCSSCEREVDHVSARVRIRPLAYAGSIVLHVRRSRIPRSRRSLKTSNLWARSPLLEAMVDGSSG